MRTGIHFASILLSRLAGADHPEERRGARKLVDHGRDRQVQDLCLALAGVVHARGCQRLASRQVPSAWQRADPAGARRRDRPPDSTSAAARGDPQNPTSGKPTPIKSHETEGSKRSNQSTSLHQYIKSPVARPGLVAAVRVPLPFGLNLDLFPVGRGGSPCRWWPAPMAAKSTCRSSGGPSWRRVRPALRRRTGSRSAGIAPGAYQRASPHINGVRQFVDALYIADTGPSPQSMACHAYRSRENNERQILYGTRDQCPGVLKRRVCRFRNRGIGATPVSHADACKSLQI